MLEAVRRSVTLHESNAIVKAVLSYALEDFKLERILPMTLPVHCGLVCSAALGSNCLMPNSNHDLNSNATGCTALAKNPRCSLISSVLACAIAVVLILTSGCASTTLALPIVLDTLSCASGSISIPGNATCKVELSGIVPEGAAIQMVSSNRGVSVPTTVLVPAGATTAEFSAKVSPGLAAGTAELTATYARNTRTFQLTLASGQAVSALGSLSCGDTVVSPGTAACSVNLTGPAPVGGSGVHLASSNAGVSVPTWVVVPGGSTSASFTVNVSSGLPSQAVTLTATFNQLSKAVQLQINGNSVASGLNSISCSESSLGSPASASCRVNLTGPAPVGGSGVHLASSNAGVSVPTWVVVPGGSTSASFTVNVSSGVPSQAVTLTATLNAISKAMQIQINGNSLATALNSISCSESSLGSPASASCSVNLTGAAPSGGSGVHLTSSNAGVSVPAWVVVPGGSTSASFTVNVSSGLPSQPVILTATLNAISKAMQLQINGNAAATALNSISCSESSLGSPASASCSVSLTGAAPSGGSGVHLTSSNAGVSVPTWVVVPAGSKSASFVVNVSSGQPTGTVTLTATFNQLSKAVQLQINGNSPVITVAVAPSAQTLQTSSTQQFTASVSGTSNTAVSWAISGPGCSGNTCGAISSTGLYTAPAAVPSPSNVNVTATSRQDTSKSASANVVIAASPVIPSAGTTYYVAPASAGGNDQNNGLSANAPWLTPNHPVNCGDVLLAAAGTYLPSSFSYGQWGPVSCTKGNNVAWVKCATPFGCRISETVYITASYWGLQGFNLSSDTGTCLSITPNFNGNRVEVHHIVVANNIVGPCGFDGISSVSGYQTNPTIGADYLAYIGNIAYNTGGNSSTCAAAMSFWVPIPYDSQAGTHLYMAGNFAWGNTSNCGDGEGIIFDTFDGVEGASTQPPYAYQAVAENNLTIFNNGPGIQVDLNQNGSGSHAPIYFIHNTSAYNCLGPSNADYCAEIVLGTTVNANASYNLVVAPSQYAFGGNLVKHYGSAAMYAPSSTNHISNEFAYSAYGYGVGNVGSTGFAPGAGNITSIDPVLANPASPGTPSCSGFATTTACMANVIANFAPTEASAVSYGYQQPSNTPVKNSYYPKWLCGVSDLPSGLVTPGCAP